IAPEIEEEEEPVFEGECTLASDCGGPQDVCSNGRCVTLPIPVEEKEKPIPPEPKPEPPVVPKVPPEPEMPPPPAEPEPAPEPEPTPPPEPPAEGPPTGDIVSLLSNMITGWLTGEGKFQCEEECRPCNDCNQKVEELLKKFETGELTGPGGCTNRMECDQHCYNWDNEEECDEFFKGQGLETYFCWQETCRECEICRYESGDIQCNEHQYFDMERGHCDCEEGWTDCDGDWENGCERQGKECEGCQSKADCAQDRCAPWGNVIQQFDCVKGEEWRNEIGVVRFVGNCNFHPSSRIDGWVHFDMWGEPFEELHPIREEAEREMGEEWCKWKLETTIKERVELQNSLTPEFLKWFFEEYIPSSPSEWEKHAGGIFDSYWRLVDNNRQVAESSLCLGMTKIPEEYEPIDVSYDTEFGSVRIWETETTTNFFGKPVKILSPYMQIWIFPTKDFLKEEFREGMEKGMMPGPEGKKKPELSPSEIEEAKKNPQVMDIVNSMSEKYGGEAKFLLQFVDGEELVFNALITVNPDILIKMEPMETYEGEYDAKFIMEFDFLYEMIRISEEEMKGAHIEQPPWDQTPRFDDMFRGLVNGVREWFMIQSAIASGQIRAEPGDAINDGLTLMQFVFEGPGGGPKDERGKGPPEGGPGQGTGQGTGEGNKQ
ncbi:MAG: hypothetical protein V3U72_03680, partial [Candidatus Aenigmarchaeota archaeon]